MNIKFENMIIGIATASALIFPSIAQALPILKSDVTVMSQIVTVGDMFENAGNLSETALFRSPAPGTTGMVSLQNIASAATRIGLIEFDNPGLFNVSVSRSGTLVDESTFETLITQDLLESGTLRQGMNVSVFLNSAFTPLFVEEGSTPAVLNNLRYVAGDNRFSARFKLAGQNRMIDISGRLDFTIQAPHLSRSVPTGTILGPNDIEMRSVPIQLSNGAGIAMPEQIVGKQLQRNMLGGAMIRISDVVEPTLISRNEIVTLFLKAGAMTLTVKGRALDDAAKGEPVSVLNLLSNSVVQGIALSAGTVEISTNSTLVASL
ncbi:hypothetical protein MNBD_ALPHA11-987 [hydrothermal vent metagenome]|uniref:SAF domain-containing protein n=1 Tax=hydrothermal vent metagenome TaxID=652676 RepID=A0A3B0U6A8_9ZZZZ